MGILKFNEFIYLANTFPGLTQGYNLFPHRAFVLVREKSDRLFLLSKLCGILEQGWEIKECKKICGLQF